MDLERIKEIEESFGERPTPGVWISRDDAAGLCRLAKIGLSTLLRVSSGEGPAWVREAARDWSVDA